MATINHGWALIMQGEHAAGIPEVREGVAMVDATGAGLVRPSYLGMLASAALLEGDRQSAAARLDEALDEADRTDHAACEAARLTHTATLTAAGGGGRPAQR